MNNEQAAAYHGLCLVMFLPPLWSLLSTFFRYMLFDRKHHVWPNPKRLFLTLLSAILEVAGVTALLLVVAARVHAVVVIALMSCIFWLPRQELLSWLRTILGLDRFYDEDGHAYIHEEWSTVQNQDDTRSLRSVNFGADFSAIGAMKRTSFFHKRLEQPLALLSCFLQVVTLGGLPFWVWWTTKDEHGKRDDIILIGAPLALLAISIAWWPAFQNKIATDTVSLLSWNRGVGTRVGVLFSFLLTPPATPPPQIAA